MALVVVALLGTTLVGIGGQHASAAPIPQDASKEELQELCELSGGNWLEDLSGKFACFYDGWNFICDGTTCEFHCYDGPDGACAREVAEVERRLAAHGTEEQVVAPVSTPAPTRGTSRTAAPATVATDGSTTLIVVAKDEQP